LTNFLEVASNNVDIAGTTASQDVYVTEDENATVRSPQDLATTNLNEPQPIGSAADPACKSVEMDLKEDDAASRTMDVDTQVHHGDVDTNKVEMSASLAQPLAATMETPAPDWLKRMLDYLRGVSDNPEWQNLVSVLLKFENLNPPSGVGHL
jgi:hypothetical protein